MAEGDKKKEEEEPPDPEPYWATNHSFLAHAILQIAVVAASIVCEAIHCYLDLGALFARQSAASNGEITDYDRKYDGDGSCLLYFIPSTLLSPQPMGAVAGPLWRIVDVLALLFVFASAVPVRWLLTSRMWNEWTGPFSAKQGPWYEGWIMILVGASIIGVPTNVIGPELYHGFRYGVGWALIGYGALTLGVGLIWGKNVRWLRGQIKRPLPPDPREGWQIVEDELKALRKAMRETYIIRLPMGELEKYWEDLQDALDLIK